MSTGQLIVTIAFVGLLGALHLVLRTARAPAGATAVAAPRAGARRDPIVAVLVLATLAALTVAGVALVMSVVDDDDDTAAPTTRATTTTPTATTTTAAPPPPQPPPPAPAPLEPPAGTAFVARVVTDADGSLSASGNRVGKAPTVAVRETGIYAVRVPGLSGELRKRAAVRVRPADGTSGVRVSVRKIGPQADFVVFTRDARTGDFAASGFEFAVFLPKQDLEGTAGEKEDGRPQLPGTR